MLRFLLSASLLAALSGDDGAPGRGPEPAVQEPAPSPASWTVEPSERVLRRALDDGLAYLARRQAETANGSFPLDDVDAKHYAPVGITALGVLAFMAGGNLPDRGPYGHEVTRSIEYLLDHTNLAPESPEYGYISSTGDKVSQTHGHGFATLALAQAYGMSPRSERIERALKAAVRLIEQSQGSEGGWYYTPRAVASHEGSVTICLVQALRAARNVGIQVDADVIRRAEDYVERLQKPDGTFRYTLDRDDSTVALTAAGVSTLNMAGRYDTSTIRNGVDAIWSRLMLGDEDGKERSFPCYERLYLAQAFWQLSDRTHFERWFADERQKLLRTQRSDGSWRNTQYGSCYATAVNCLVLAIPEGVLPIFQR